MNVLTPLQREFLARFFAGANAQKFYLTGGGALAEFYLGHRLSRDIDLFTQDKQAWQEIEPDLKTASDKAGALLNFKPAMEENELHRAFVQLPGESMLKIDLVRDSPPYFGKPVTQPDGVIVDSLENIAVGKLLALYGRAYPRDFVDIYFLLKEGWDFRRLVTLGKEKDPGLFEHYLAEMLRQVLRIPQEDLPIMLKPLDLEEMKAFYLKLADDLLKAEKANV